MKDTAGNGDLLTKLEFLGLDLENIPEYLKDFSPLNFNTSRLNNDKDHRVYRFVPIDKIEVLITPCLRSDDIKKKYSNAVPLGRFFNPDGDQDDIERYATLLKIVNSLSVTEIENMTTLQKSLEKTEPFKVKYSKDHLWQIYYSVSTDKYFMLVCSKEETFTEFLYLLKKKIEFKKNKRARVSPSIFVPINYINYSEEYLNRDEIANTENYLWLFTKNWPLIFEVYDKKNNMSIQIVGDTYVYNNVKSSYKVKLTDKEEALKFYKLLKALFILQTEIKNHFEFETKIDSKNGLELYLGQNRITYENLEEFIESEYKIAKAEINCQDISSAELEAKLEELKHIAKEKENEYLEKQKEISTYLEYKKTFFGKVKYFFKSNKKNKRTETLEEKILNEFEKKEVSPAITQIDEKRFYTIEDLVVIYSIKDKGEKKIKDLSQDIKALELKIENLISKVKNAELYIEEIDKHKKSIFEFWKFANKDEKLSLEMGNETAKRNDLATFKKAFDLEMDFETLGISVDRTQRVKLSKEETDSLFIAQTELLKIINMLKNGNMNKNKIEEALEDLKEEFNKNRLYIDSEVFDIFGNIDNDSRKIKYIGSRSHRENEKSKFRILNINKKIDVFDFTEKLLSIISYIEGAIPKMKSKYDMPLYKVVPITENINETNFEIFDINVENALRNFKDSGEGAVNLLKINYKEEIPLLYYSNIIYYDNNNKTLPEGMNLSSNVLIDCKKLEFKLVGQTKFRTNNYFNEQNNLILPKSKDILVYEYDVSLKTEDSVQNNVDETEENVEDVIEENDITVKDFEEQEVMTEAELQEIVTEEELEIAEQNEELIEEPIEELVEESLLDNFDEEENIEIDEELEEVITTFEEEEVIQEKVNSKNEKETEVIIEKEQEEKEVIAQKEEKPKKKSTTKKKRTLKIKKEVD